MNTCTVNVAHADNNERECIVERSVTTIIIILLRLRLLHLHNYLTEKK